MENDIMGESLKGLFESITAMSGTSECATLFQA
jgi:hypothetical protein